LISGVELLTTNSNTEQERDLRRHSHIGTFHRGLSKYKNSNMTKPSFLISIGIDQNEAATVAKSKYKIFSYDKLRYL